LISFAGKRANVLGFPGVARLISNAAHVAGTHGICRLSCGAICQGKVGRTIAGLPVWIAILATNGSHSAYVDVVVTCLVVIAGHDVARVAECPNSGRAAEAYSRSGWRRGGCAGCGDSLEAANACHLPIRQVNIAVRDKRCIAIFASIRSRVIIAKARIELGSTIGTRHLALPTELDHRSGVVRGIRRHTRILPVARHPADQNQNRARDGPPGSSIHGAPPL